MYVLKYIEFKSIYKFLAVGFFLVFIWGIITFIGILFDVGFLKILLTFFSNRQFLVTGNGMYDLRARSTFFEPGFYAYFINLNLPLFYNIHKSKYQILKNKYCNFIIKHSLYPLAIINIILSFSAMGYAFMFIILVYIYFKELLPKLKKTKFLIRFCILSFVIIGAVPFYIHTYSQNNNVAFKRVQNALYVLYSGNIIALYETDASLFTRIVSYTNEFILFQHNPILGVGLEQAKYKMPDLFEVSPLPLTFENRHFLYQSYLTKKLVFNRNLLCDSLAETGLLGCIFLYLFMIKTWLINKKLEKYDFGIDKEFTKILNDILFLLIVFSFYEIGIIGLSYHFFILAISNEIILRRKMRICNKYYHINTKGRL